MRQKIEIFAILGAFISLVGERWTGIWVYVVGEPSPMIRSIVALAQRVDIWLIEQGVFVAPLTFFILLLVGSLFWPQIWAHARRYNHHKKAFERRFDLLEHQQSRQDFAWYLENQYRNSQLQTAGPSLSYRLEGFRFPKDYPPTPEDTLGSFARNKMTFDRTEDEELWKFFKATFERFFEIYNPDHDPPKALQTFFNSRRIASKFWDDTARSIIKGRLRISDIKRPIEVNFTLIRALALSELAMAHEFTWDQGRGKTSLFVAALGLDKLDDVKWRRYLR